MTQDTFHRIAQLQAQYARCIDDGDLAAWPAFFEDACLYKITTAENHRLKLEAGIIYATSRGMLTDRVSSLRDANIYERHSYRHLLGQPYILDEPARTDTAPDCVRCETSFMVARIMRDGTTSLYVTGRYLDVFRLGAQTLRIKERVVVCDSSRIDTLLALPL
jgi:anthranilate 1,2-dioxygenase small subunit